MCADAVRVRLQLHTGSVHYLHRSGAAAIHTDGGEHTSCEPVARVPREQGVDELLPELERRIQAAAEVVLCQTTHVAFSTWQVVCAAAFPTTSS